MLRITWCLLTAAIVFLATGALLFELDGAVWLQDRFMASAIWLAQHGVPAVFLNAMHMLEQAMIFGVPFVLGLFVFDRLVKRPDGYTRCGNCGGILEQLVLPRCPLCRNRI